MKNFYLIGLLVLLSSKLFGQAKPVPPPPLPFREVSGIVKDETGQGAIGALVTLKSTKDTMRVATNDDGIFVFKNVKMATFNVTVDLVGSETFVKKYLNSDVTKRIVLDPIALKPKANELNEVKINGAPSITYKTDTVEYRASDYKVRENSTVDELLKKMEGMEVGTDGSLVHQGENVVKAKLNGKEFSGGSIAQAIKNLPADIVEKIQIVDDYGDQAARTGIKDGVPQKILNITTKPDKSVGTISRNNVQVGNHDRYNVEVSAQRINANQVINVIGKINKSVLGVGGGNPGVTQSGDPTISYRDQWSKKVQVNSNFKYNFSNNNYISSQDGFINSNLGKSVFTQTGSGNSSNRGYNGNFQVEIQADSLNFIQVNPWFNQNNSKDDNENTRDQYDNFKDLNNLGARRLQHRIRTGTNYNTNDNTSYGMGGLYVHLFKKPKRNISFNFGISRNESQANGGSNQSFKYYADSTLSTPITSRDSTANVLTRRSNNSSSYSGTITYTEPLGTYSLLEIRGELSRNTNEAEAHQDSIAIDPQTGASSTYEILNRRNIYNYTVDQSRYTLSYRYTGLKVNFSIGATAIPYTLSGQKLDISSNNLESTSRSTFRVIPSFRFAYQWSRTQRFQITYSGNNIQPQFQQIQPFTDVSNPFNIVIGNPNLSPAFSHSLNANYNNYIANSKLNFSFGSWYNKTDDRITTNRVIVQDAAGRNVGIQRFINLDGTHSAGGNYSISKQLDDRRYNLALNGTIQYGYTTAKDQDIEYHSTSWRINERFGPRISPNDNIEINPYVSYDLSRNFSTANKGTSTRYKRTALAVDGRIWFLKTFQFNYNASKNFVDGVQNIGDGPKPIPNTANPLIINLGLQKEFFPKKNLVLTFNVYDLLHQNSFIRQDVDENTGSITNTLSSTLSRYFMFGARLYLQKWSGRPQRNGQNMRRRGDGSFIY